MIPRRLKTICAAAGVGLVTFVVFLPSRHAAFLNWDDDALIVQNADFRGLGWSQLAWMFRTTYMGHYQPLTWLTFAMNFEVGGLDAAGYHLTNVLLHALAAAFAFALTSRLLEIAMPAGAPGARTIASCFAALAFAIHPLRVESVAWVTERRDVLSGALLLAAVWAWLGYAAGGRRPRLWYVLSVALLALSLLAKAWGMTLFAVLLVLDAYPLRRWSRPAAYRLLIEKTPFFALGVAAAGMALFAQSLSVIVVNERSWGYRALQSVYGLVFYPWTTLLPIGLSPIHEHPTELHITEPRLIAALLVILLLTGTLIALRRRWPAGLATWAIYVIVISPVLGVVQAGPQFVADRYSYLACLPFAILLAAGLAKLLAGRAARAAFVAALLVLVALGVLTRRQIPIWNDSWSLWRAALAYDPGSWNANSNLGSLYLKAGDLSAAERHFRRAHDAVPGFALPVVNLAWCLGRMGKNDECLVLLRQAATMPTASNNDLLMIANGLAALKQPIEARAILERLIQRDPHDAEAHFRLAKLLKDAGERSRAIDLYRRTIELLEPSLGAGPVDLQHDLFAAMYAQSCRSVAGLLSSQGDSVGSESYVRKLRELETRR